MHADYADIREKIGEEPKWFDEHGVPRYCDFTPREVADIYADEVALLDIRCQSCARLFKVAMSTSAVDMAYGRRRLSANIQALHYGDPPNVDCCPAGPTMNSIPIQVLQFWKHEPRPGDWVRVPGLEVAMTDEES